MDSDRLPNARCLIADAGCVMDHEACLATALADTQVRTRTNDMLWAAPPKSINVACTDCQLRTSGHGP